MKFKFNWFSKIVNNNLWKDPIFLFKLFSFILLSLTFLLGIIYGIFIEFWYVSPKNSNQVNIPRTYNLNVMASFWSVQTNFLALIYFLFALIYHKQENKHKISNFYSCLNVTIYITLTMVLFWVLVFFGLGEPKTMAAYHFASKIDAAVTIIAHAINPVLMIIYLITFFGKEKIKLLNYSLKKTTVLLLYPICYLIFINLRAKLLFADGIKNEFLFPYPFVDFYNPILPVSKTINNVLIVIIGISMLLAEALLFILINNIYFKIKHKEIKNNLFNENDTTIKQIVT